MNAVFRRFDAVRRCALMFAVSLGIAPPAPADGVRMLGGRADFDWTHLPPGRFREQVGRLPAPARAEAERRLREFAFPPEDANSLHAGHDGALYYVDHFPAADEPAESPAESDPGIAAAAVPVAPFPDALKFHSRPGAASVLFLDFDGHTVSGTAWNTTSGVNRASIPATAFSSDSDFATYSDAEQASIKRIWQRVAEDYAPFAIDVTTEAPAVFGTRTARALITRNTDTNGLVNPASTAGGVAYVNVFASSSYAYYSPAWIYMNNLSYREDYIAEAVAHEVGHNMGLSHDGKTDGTEYYSGHGTGDTSWGPIMGTGYNRNVSQWSRGEYYLANNTEDDLSILASKLGYRTDDAGGTPAAAAYLTVATNGAILATTPETDPGNTTTANKGILERNTDADVFAFLADAGPVTLAALPWRSPADTLGGNLDIHLRLLDASGAVVVTQNPATATSATIATNLAAGQYYLEVRGVPAGAPTNATPSGYTVYGVIGQYFLTGSVVRSGAVIPPQAVLTVTNITQPALTQQTFAVTYSDNAAISTATLGAGDVRVLGPNGYDAMATLVGVDASGDGTPRTGTYRILPPGPQWAGTDAGVYEVLMVSNQVADVEGAWVPAGLLGAFTCNVPRVAYAAGLDVDPGWTLDTGWAFGKPTGSSGDPSSGFTGTNVIGYILTGRYARNTAARTATTPAINCSGASAVTVGFRRWLGVRSGDTAQLQVSRDGSTWSNAWSASGSILDTSWTAVQYDISAVAAGQSAVRLRWVMGANSDASVSYGWNLDDIVVYVDGAAPDTGAPAATLAVSDLTLGGSPTHQFTVTYTDNTAVAIASLGDGDILVVGPGGFTNTAAFLGADESSDGTPRTALYSVDAPGGTWDSADNGTYAVSLVYGEISDTAGNEAPETELGSFLVGILPRWTLTVAASPPGAGTVAPPGGEFPQGSIVDLSATPGEYHRFAGWSGAAGGTNNPLAFTMASNSTVTALFAEVLTTTNPTPLWWLASFGISGDFETAVTRPGANGLPFWASYIAGLDPTNSASVLAVGASVLPDGRTALAWPTVSGRVYTVTVTTNLAGPFEPMPSAVRLPWTDNVRTSATPGFFRVEVEKE